MAKPVKARRTIQAVEFDENSRKQRHNRGDRRKGAEGTDVPDTAHKPRRKQTGSDETHPPRLFPKDRETSSKNLPRRRAKATATRGDRMP